MDGLQSPEQTNRADKLLSVCQSRLVEHLLSYVAPVFDRTNERLFELAEKAGNNEQQSRLFEALSELKRCRMTFTDGLNESIHHEFREFNQGNTREEPEDSESEQTLTLIDEDELDQSLAITDMVGKAEVRFTQPIYALNQRISVINGGVTVKNHSNPLAPAKIGNMLRAASEKLDLNGKYLTLLFTEFDEELQHRLGDCYKDLNKYLAEAGILPNLKMDHQRNGASHPEAEDKPPQDQPKPQQAETDPAQATAAHQQTPTPQSAQPAHGGTPAKNEKLHQDNLRLLGEIRSMLGTLSQRKNGGTPAEPSPAAAPNHVPAPQLDNMLSQLQQQQSGPEATTGFLTPGAIRARLNQLAQQDQPQGQPQPALPAHQHQTIDLVGMIYDYIGKHSGFSDPIQHLLQKLQVPILRSALKDEGFFADNSHPAREFFDTVTDAAELWLDDNPKESPTLNKIQTAVDGVLAGYQGDNEVFSRFLTDLNKHIQLLNKKASIKERRNIEAMKGQERLTLARQHANELVDKLISSHDAPEFAASLLKQSWADFLTLGILRHGEDSEEVAEAEKVAKLLVISVKRRLPEPLKNKIKPQVSWLKEQLTAGLSQVGYTESETEKVLHEMEACHRWSLDQQQTGEGPQELHQPATASQAQQGQESEEQEQSVTTLEQKVKAEDNLTQEEKAQLAKLRLTAFGTWFEIRFDEKSDWRKRKLSWYSPMSGKCLLVNNRGAIAEDMTLAELAKLTVQGNARVYSKETKPPLLDRALRVIFSRLKQLAPHPAPVA